MRHLLISFFAILFCAILPSCNNDDDNGNVYPKDFIPFAKNDTCFTATVEIGRFSQVGLVFDVDEKKL